MLRESSRTSSLSSRRIAQDVEECGHNLCPAEHTGEKVLQATGSHAESVVLSSFRGTEYGGVSALPSHAVCFSYLVSVMIYYTMHSSTDWLRPHERSKHHVFHSYLRTTPQKPSNTDPLREVWLLTVFSFRYMCVIASQSDWTSPPTRRQLEWGTWDASLEELCLGEGTVEASSVSVRAVCCRWTDDRPPGRQRALLVS